MDVRALAAVHDIMKDGTPLATDCAAVLTGAAWSDARLYTVHHPGTDLPFGTHCHMQEPADTLHHYWRCRHPHVMALRTRYCVSRPRQVFTARHAWPARPCTSVDDVERFRRRLLFCASVRAWVRDRRHSVADAPISLTDCDGVT